MKFTKFTSGTVLAVVLTPGVLSAPASLESRQAPVTDLDVLQFALTLEHLENVFYKNALQRFSQADFLAAGFSSSFYQNLLFIAHDEEAHVQFLQQAITSAGGTPVVACEYNFPYTDIVSFVALSSVLEGVGVSAYLGGAPVISSKDILAAAGAILVAEGLHQSVQRTAILEAASANIVGTPVPPSAIFSIASAFLKSCPSSNAALPFQAFPTLTLNIANPSSPGVVAAFTFDQSLALPSTLFVTFVTGLDIISVPAQVPSAGVVTAAIPQKAQGQIYAMLTNVEVSGSIADSAIVAGPAIIEVTPPLPTVDFSVS